jgi:hypothetical protein
VYNHARHKVSVLSQGMNGRLNNKLQSMFSEMNDKERVMAKFTRQGSLVRTQYRPPNKSML